MVLLVQRFSEGKEKGGGEHKCWAEHGSDEVRGADRGEFGAKVLDHAGLFGDHEVDELDLEEGKAVRYSWAEYRHGQGY